MPTYLSPGVYVEEVDSGSKPIEGVGTAVCAFVGIAETGPKNTPVRLSNWNAYTAEFGGFTEHTFLPQAVYGYFLNGGGSCYVVNVGSSGSPTPALGEINANVEKGDSKDTESKAKYEIESKLEGTDGNDLSVEVADLPGNDAGEDSFKLTVKRGGKAVENFDELTVKRGKKNAVTVVNARSELITIQEAKNAPPARPVPGEVKLAGGSAPSAVEAAPTDYIGDSADRTGFGGLETIDEITMVCVPDVMAAYRREAIGMDDVKDVQLKMIAHCELMGDRVAIIDPPPDLKPQAVHEWRMNDAGYDSKYAAMYWPWVKVKDPVSGDTIEVPPSGHVAGIWGRNDDTRGVHKAPANEVVRGALGPAFGLTSLEQELLNPVGINCIRSFSGRGTRVWGARTLSSDPEWRYLNVRRLFNYLEESILIGTQWAVFEPNDHALWAKIRRTITAFLTNEWRKGALFGLTTDQAFFVACDETTNPQSEIDAGRVVCEIGVAPVKPAEFVIFRLSQYAAGADVAE